MRIKDVIDKVNELRPHQFDDEIVVGWLSDIDSMITHDFLQMYSKDRIAFTPYVYEKDTELDDELLLPDPFSSAYIHYVAAQVDFYNGEIGRYNNSMSMYNGIFYSYAAYYNRHNMPVQGASIDIGV